MNIFNNRISKLEFFSLNSKLIRFNFLKFINFTSFDKLELIYLSNNKEA